MKLNPAKSVKIAMLVLRALGSIAAEVRAAKDPASPGGSKITRAEALDIVLAAFGSIAEDVAGVLADE